MTINVCLFGAELLEYDARRLSDTGNEVFALLKIDEYAFTTEIGKPKLPMVTTVLEVPHKAQIRFEVLSAEYNEIDLLALGIDKRIAPALASVIKMPNAKASFVLDEKTYSTNAYYPDKIADIYETADGGLARGHRLATLIVYPVHYNPVLGRIRCYTNIKVRVVFLGGDIHETQRVIAQDYSTLWEGFIERTVVNYPQYLKGIPPLPIYYDIFYNGQAHTVANKLAKWKMKKGFKVRMWNAAGWSASAIDDTVRFQNPRATFLLIIGDPNGSIGLPSGTATAYTGQTDLYYAEVDGGGTYLPDMFYGRLSVADTVQGNTAVNKAISWEEANFGSTGTAWLKRACLIAGYDATYQSVGIATNAYCRARLLPYGYQVDTLVIAANENNVRVINQINDGRVWCVYTAHGTQTAWAISKSGSITVTNLTNLLNNDMYPLPAGHCCLTGDFDYSSQCFGETWDRLSGKGGLNYYGSVTYTYWDEDDWLQRRYFDAIYTDSVPGRLYEVGRFTLWALYWIQNNTNSIRKRYYFETYHLFNDPSLDFWTDIPQYLSLGWSGAAEWGEIYRVYVHDGQHNPIKDALVCIWNKQGWPGGIHLTAYSGTDGYAYLGPIPSGFYEGSANLTVSKHNYRPNLQDINIVAIKGPYYLNASSPNPISIKLTWRDFSGREAGFIIARKVDDGPWNYNWRDIAQQNLTECIDTDVQFGRKYTYMVRCYDAGYLHLSPWSNEAATICGTIAQSGYPKMSAFNNNPKVIRGPDGKIHTVYYNGNEVFYSYSADGGVSFAPWQVVCRSDTTPAFAIDRNGTLWIVNATHYWPNYNTCALAYYLYKKTDGGWQKSYDKIYQKNLGAQHPNLPAVLHPPSFAIVGDTGYIAFKEPQNISVCISRFPLALSTNYALQILGENGYYPSIGHDRADPNSLTDDRVVALVHESSYGRLRLYYRRIGTSQWHSLEIPNLYALGAPALWTGQNELRISFEGQNIRTQQEGLFFLRIPWQNNTYNVNLPLELVSSNCDFDDYGIEGYSYLASQDVVLWKYDNDIYYSQRQGGVWTTPVNIYQSSDISSYPQGIVFGSASYPRLFALWTEKVGSNYYLVRKIINLPPPYQNIQTIAQVDNPEATGYNNTRRLLRDTEGRLHLAFTSGDSVYHTYFQNNAWTEPVYIGRGKYPALASGPEGKIYCLWTYNQGYPDFLEQLCFSRFDGINWTTPTALLYTYNSFF